MVETDFLICDRDARTLGTAHHKLAAYYLITCQIKRTELIAPETESPVLGAYAV